MIRRLLLPLLLLGFSSGYAQQNPYSITHFPTVVATVTGFTSAPIDLAKGTSVGNSFNTCAVTVVGSALTTATFGLLGSYDGGVSYYPINIYPVLTPTVGGATATATANGAYTATCTNVDHIEIVTSGTFTATNIQVSLSGAPNGVIARNAGGGASVGAVNTLQKVGATAGSFAPTFIVEDTNGNAIQFNQNFLNAFGAIQAFNGQTGFLNYASAYIALFFNHSDTDLLSQRIISGHFAQTDLNMYFDTLATGGFNFRIPVSGAYTTPLRIAANVLTTPGGVLPSIDPAVTVGQAVCIKAAGPPLVIGKCTSVVGAGGACTCA